jgi:hypothetical protein
MRTSKIAQNDSKLNRSIKKETLSNLKVRTDLKGGMVSSVAICSGCHGCGGTVKAV